MSTFRAVLSLVLTPSVYLMSLSMAWAQSASIHDLPVDSEQKTTITIEKGRGSAESRASTSAREVLDGTAEVTGDPKPLERVARESWLKACEDWKKEVKELNRENQVAVLNCNRPKCTKDGVLTVCQSTATYKILMKTQ